MTIITVKKRILIYSLIAIIALGAVLAMFTLGPFSKASANNGITIVIDAGHGGIDGGVVGKTSGQKESDVNLWIAQSLKHFLIKGGYNVILTRKDSGGLYDSSASNLKLSDMKKRKEIINAAKPDLMVSIHQNSYPLSKVKGAQVFYDASSENSAAAAKTIQDILNDSLSCDRVSKTAEYYILQCSPYTSVLVECGFLSNPDEERLLLTPSYREKVAYALYTAICHVFSDPNAGKSANL